MNVAVVQDRKNKECTTEMSQVTRGILKRLHTTKQKSQNMHDIDFLQMTEKMKRGKQSRRKREKNGEKKIATNYLANEGDGAERASV